MSSVVMHGDQDVNLRDDLVVVLEDQVVKVYLWRTTINAKQHSVKSLKISDQEIYLMLLPSRRVIKLHQIK